MASTAGNLNRNQRKAVAEDTLAGFQRGSSPSGRITNLKEKIEYTNANTLYFPPDSELGDWKAATATPGTSKTKITLEEISTLVGAHQLFDRLSADSSTTPRVGILNFASAKNPGGGFLSGSRAQEESIARSSTLYPSLTTPTAQRYYQTHRKDPKGGYYSHAMIFSPNVAIVKDDEGKWVDQGWDDSEGGERRVLEIDIVTSPAVNAGVVRKSTKVTAEAIESTMRERMARILYLFEKQGIRHIVLGSFGTGAFRNDVDMVAKLWKELLCDAEARYIASFENVVFAVLGRETFLKFVEVFGANGSGETQHPG